MSFKITEVVPVHLTFELDAELRKVANEAGCSNSEYMRDLFCLSRHGVTFGELVANHRRELMQARGPEQVQLRASSSRGKK